MFVVTEADAAAIRAVYQQRGEFAAAVELRQRFPGITDNAQARECARTIAGWKPLPLRPVKRMPKAAVTAGALSAVRLPRLSRSAHFLAGLEERHRLLPHCHHLAGARIAPDAGAALFHCESTETTQLHTLAASQSGGDLVEYRRDDQFDVLLSQMRTAGGEFRDEF